MCMTVQMMILNWEIIMEFMDAVLEETLFEETVSSEDFSTSSYDGGYKLQRTFL